MKKKTLVMLIPAVAGLVLSSVGCSSVPPKNALKNWPPGTSPAEVGKRVAGNFLERKFRYQTTPEKAQLGVIYPEACAWYGSLKVARLTGDKELTNKLIQKFEPLLTEDGSSHVNRSAHVDYRVFGIVPLEIYIETKDLRCLKLGLELADAQWNNPGPDGITAEARYWIDDMYMIPAVQVQAFRATGEAKYLDRAALTMSAYLDRLQQPNGLFYHGVDSHFFWGRGNGWVAAGMAELLSVLPEDHPQRARIMRGYKTMMESLWQHQGADGMWRQLIDDPDSWPETSSTAMFTFAMVTGVKQGWLASTTYGPAARKAWLGLVRYLDDEGNVGEVCVGTNKGFDKQFYLDRARVKGDLHGQAATLWSAFALLQPARE